jgi:hypothetical protein
MNRIITMYLRCLAGNRFRSWLRLLPWVEYCYNIAYQATLKATPFQVVYRRTPPPMIPFQPGSTKEASVDHQLRDKDTFPHSLQRSKIDCSKLRPF